MSCFELKKMIKLNEVTFKVDASADGRFLYFLSLHFDIRIWWFRRVDSFITQTIADFFLLWT